MVTKQTLSVYGFTYMDEYFEHLLDLKTEGEIELAKEGFDNLSSKQQDLFYDYVEAFYSFEYESDMNYEMRSLKEYFN